MAKNILAGVAGVLVAGLLVWLVEMVGHSVYPPPADLDFADADAMRAYMQTLQVGAFLFVGAAWFAGALGGTFTACRIGDANPLIYAVVVGGLMFAASTANLVMIPHPMWFSALGLAGVLVGTWLGMSFGSKRTAAE